MTDHSLQTLVIEGTIREGRKSIHPARYVTNRFLERGHDVELFDMMEYEIPLFTNRRDLDSDPHPDVDVFGQMVESANLIVIVTPEYNHSIPGVLKNLLDHLYPEYENTPFAYVTVSSGGFGGVRALRHLHELTVYFNAHPGPDLPVSNVADVFDENSTLTDDTYDAKFEKFIEQAVIHAEQHLASRVEVTV